MRYILFLIILLTQSACVSRINTNIHLTPEIEKEFNNITMEEALDLLKRYYSSFSSEKVSWSVSKFGLLAVEPIGNIPKNEYHSEYLHSKPFSKTYEGEWVGPGIYNIRTRSEKWVERWLYFQFDKINSIRMTENNNRIALEVCCGKRIDPDANSYEPAKWGAKIFIQKEDKLLSRYIAAFLSLCPNIKLIKEK